MQRSRTKAHPKIPTKDSKIWWMEANRILNSEKYITLLKLCLLPDLTEIEIFQCDRYAIHVTMKIPTNEDIAVLQDCPDHNIIGSV